MTAQPNNRLPTISIIHGARMPFESSRGDEQWMMQLKERLCQRGFASVSLFQWSGGFMRSFLTKAAVSYAQELQRLWKECEADPNGPRSLAIHAKSSGAFVAEAALRLVSREAPSLRVDTLLRIATPDPRKAPMIPSLRRVVNLLSPADSHYRLGLVVSRCLALGGFLPEGSATPKQERLVFAGLRHSDFNRPIRRPEFADGDLFDLYARFLSGDGP